MTSNQPRKIVVNGVGFRWKADILARDNQRVIQVRMWQVRAGSTLIAWLVGKDAGYVDTAYPTPKDVRLLIECGISKGWNFGERGANLSLTSADRIELDGLVVLDIRMSENEQKPKPKIRSRFVAGPNDFKFVTSEEADARVKQRRAELQAFREEMRREAEEQRKRAQEADDKSAAET